MTYISYIHYLYSSLYYRERFLTENVDTLKVLLSHLKSNPNSILLPEYENYTSLLERKTTLHSSTCRIMKVYRKEILDELLKDIQLPSDILSHIGIFVNIVLW